MLKDEIINQIDEPVELSNVAIDRQLNDSYKENLINRGLSEAEADQFLALLDKVKSTEEDLSGFDHEMSEGIPFEGGMGFTEALTGMKIAYEIY